MNNNRIVTIDYLRGLAATGVMIYHYSCMCWSWERFGAETILGRIGIYAVSIFYILSGLTLFAVYNQRLKFTKVSLYDFFIKRIFRIFPLLWLASTATIILSGSFPSLKRLFLNYTGLFGLIKPTAYVATGAWSIGNELVFYLFFPLFVFLQCRKFLLSTLAIVVFGISGIFAFYILDPRMQLHTQWGMYVNPLNQLFFFLSGYLIGLFASNVIVKKRQLRTLLILSVILFIIFPSKGNQISLVTSVSRVVFSGVCILAVFSVYRDSYNMPGFLSRFLSMLGEASYSVYLLHPLVFSTVVIVNKTLSLKLSSGLLILISIITTFVFSYIIYLKMEKPFMKIGRNIIHKFANNGIRKAELAEIP